MSLVYGDGRYMRSPVFPGPWYTSARPQKVKDPGLLYQGPSVFRDNKPVFHRKFDVSGFPMGYGFPQMNTDLYKSGSSGFGRINVKAPFFGTLNPGPPVQVAQNCKCEPIYVPPNGEVDTSLTVLAVGESIYFDVPYNVVSYQYVSVIPGPRFRWLVWASIDLVSSLSAWSGWRTRITTCAATLDESNSVNNTLYKANSKWMQYHSTNQSGLGLDLTKYCTVAEAVDAIQAFYRTYSRYTTPDTYVINVSGYDPASKIDKINQLVPSPHPFLFDVDVPPDIRWDAATDAAISARSLNINTGQFLAEIPLLGKTIKTILSVKKLSPKAIADAYLSLYYGLRLTVLDSKEIASEVKRKASEVSRDSRRIRSRKSYQDQGNVNVIYNLTIDYSPYEEGYVKLLNTLMSIDLFPSLKNVWDIIPFSFVLDWFINIQDVLEEIDTNTFWSTCKISSVIESKKVTRPVTLSGTSERVLLTDYTRDVNFELPPCRPKIDDPGLPSLRNWVNGFFLVLQKAGR